MSLQADMRFPWKKLIPGFAGLLAALLTYWLVPGTSHPQAPLMAAITVLMAAWWIFEVVPIPVTSLFPLFLLPLTGIADVAETATYYGKSTIFLFLGGFLLALGLQRSGVHKRIALQIVWLAGSRPSGLVLGFMISCGFLSMWISNTAAVMVMLPIALSVLEQAKEMGAKGGLGNFAVCLMLGIAYSADIGGMGTLIGTPPNMIYNEMLGEIFPGAPKTGFLPWMMMGLPLSLLFMTGGWLLLTRVIFKLPRESIFGGRSVIRQIISQLGKVRRDEWLSAGIFGLAALLWMTGEDLVLGDNFTLPGWRSSLGLTELDDAGVAIATAVLLFLVPSADRPGQALMNWEAAKQVPWGILLLFGGGFAIAGGFTHSGLSALVGDLFAGLTIGSPALLVVLVCILLTFLTEVTSNTAITNLVLPILAKAGVALGLDPRILMIPATLSASCAFMMPVASPTQAIVFGSGHVSIKQMVRAGIWFNVLGIILVSAVFLLWGGLVLGIDLSEIPAWAISATTE
ncbi:MAG: DASS family sodium-coupled anion symporter [Bacteroidia bacterium]|nr:DASS family sodium-coupled anion symporter [Bacteroidia bacterium]